MRFAAAIFIVLIALSAGASAQGLASALVPYWNQSVGGYAEEVESNIVYLGTGDLNGDGYGEVVVAVGSSIASSDASRSNRVYCFSENGTLLWSRGFENQIRSVALADVDRDSELEILVGTGQEIQRITRGTVEVMESDGTIQSTIHSKGIIRVLSVADLNMDRSLEIIGASRNVVYVFDMIGNRVWEYSDFGSPPSDPLFVVEDLINDVTKETIVGGYRITILNQSGYQDYSPLSVESVTGKFGDRVRTLNIGRFLATGSSQILFSTEFSDNLYLYGFERPPDENFMRYVEKWAYPLDAKITVIRVYDIDGDGAPEIIYSDETGMLYVLEGNGQPQWVFRIYGKVTDIQLSDLNNDGDTEILAVSTSGSIHVLDANDGAVVWEYSIPESISSVAVDRLNLDDLSEVVAGTTQRNVHVFSVNESYTELFEAYSYYQLAQRYFLDNKYNESLKYLSKARQIYLKYESRSDLVRVDELASTIKDAVSKGRMDTANAYYNKAVQFFIDEDYTQARVFAKDSKSLYEDLGDTRNALKAELLIIKIDEKIASGSVVVTSLLENKTEVVIPSKSDKNTYLTVFVLVLLITIVLLNIAYKRKQTSSRQESAEVREYEKRLEKVLDQDLQDLGKK